MGNFDNQKMLAPNALSPNATLSPECNRVKTKPNPLLMHLSKSTPILHRYHTDTTPVSNSTR